MTIKMKDLKQGEKVDIIVRRHWIAFVILGSYFFAGFLFSAVLFGVLGFGPAILLLNTVFWMFYLMFIYVVWINYELDIFIFTNHRIVCIEQKSFLNRAVGETTLDKIQEVAIETKGLFANLFNFGTMRIMTAGSSPSFDMTLAPKPLEYQRYINNLANQYRDDLFGGPTQGNQNTASKVERVLSSGV